MASMIAVPPSPSDLWVLVIYEVIPEETKLYLVHGKLAKLALRVHNLYLNVKGYTENQNKALEEFTNLIVHQTPLDFTDPAMLGHPVMLVLTGILNDMAIY